MIRPTAVVAGAVAVAVVLTAVLPREPGGLRVGAGATTTTTAPPTTGTTEPGTTTTTTEATGSDPAFDAVVAEISDFVERERGLEFLRPVVVELAADEEFETRLLEDFEEDIPDIEASGATLKALGLVDGDVDIVEAYRTLLGAGVVGFYDSATDELVVRGADVTPYVREIIAHELVHALDDQHFELERPQIDESDDEQGFGFTALVEGDAVHVENAFVASLSDEEQDQAIEEQFDAASDPAIFQVPFVLIDMLVAPYTLGPDFVAAVRDAGGQARLDAAFAAPPTTSEQVLDPEIYLAGEGAVPVAAPVADGTELERGVLGAFGLQVLFDDIDDDTADEAVDGWGGDAYVTWRAGDDACTRLIVAGDSPADTAELETALTEWADGDATVGAAPDGTVTVTVCAAIA